MVTADGHELHQLGVIILDISVLGPLLPVKFIVVRNLKVSLLLEIGFLQKSKCSFDFTSQTLNNSFDNKPGTHTVSPCLQAIVQVQFVAGEHLQNGDNLLFTASTKLPHIMIGNCVSVVLGG